MQEHKAIKYMEYDDQGYILMTGPASELEKVIKGVASERGCPIDAGVQQTIDTMHDYERNPSKYPQGVERNQLNFGFHRMAIETDNFGDFFDEGALMLQYLFNDAGESKDSRAAHFEEVKRTFHKVLEDI